MVRIRSMLTWGLASTVLAVGVVTAVPGGAAAAPSAGAAEPSCSAFNDPIYQRNKPKNNASLVTPSLTEANGAGDYGFTQNKGTVFVASTTPAPGLVEVHRLYRWQGQDFVASADPEEWERASENNYTDQGRSFYASPVAADCLVPVYRFRKSGKNRLAAAASERTALISAGWNLEGISFYAKPSPGAEPDPEPEPEPTPTDPPAGTDTKFSFAIYPDTQQEVGKDSRFINRSQWLADNKASLDLRFVSHSGDVVNWDTPDHDQYEVASKAMVPLEKSDIPYSLAIGNHDTQATGPGGGARDSKRTRQLQRDTTTFNAYFNAERYGGVSGAFEKDKVDNIYSLYEAGGVKWMVMVVELWPRESVVSWMKSSIASHPDHNVVVVTHNYLTGGGGIEQGAGYGDVSPQELYDQVISQYANVRMVFSGHVGFARTRVDTGKNGNKIYSYLTTIHSNRTNPVRMVEVDTKANSVKSWIYAPYTKQTLVEPETLDDTTWVRP